MSDEKKIEDLKARLREATSPIDRIVLYNDPENGTIGERVVAAIEYDRENQDDKIRDAAIWAYENLEGLPEFGEEIRLAIVDTASDRLYDEGVRNFRERLVAIAKELVG